MILINIKPSIKHVVGQLNSPISHMTEKPWLMLAWIYGWPARLFLNTDPFLCQQSASQSAANLSPMVLNGWPTGSPSNKRGLSDLGCCPSKAWLMLGQLLTDHGCTDLFITILKLYMLILLWTILTAVHTSDKLQFNYIYFYIFGTVYSSFLSCVPVLHHRDPSQSMLPLLTSIPV